MNVTIYMSDRDIPLKYCSFPLPLREVLTVENYCKWYDIYVIKTDGKVYRLPQRYSQRYESENEGACAWSDHIPTPWFCRWLVNTNQKFEWDSNAWEMIVGRWVLEKRPEIDKTLLAY